MRIKFAGESAPIVTIIDWQEATLKKRRTPLNNRHKCDTRQQVFFDKVNEVVPFDKTTSNPLLHCLSGIIGNNLVPKLVEYWFDMGVANFVMGLSNFVRSLTNFVMGLANFVRSLSNFVMGLSNFVMSLTNFVMSLTKFVRSVANFVMGLTNFIRRVANFVMGLTNSET